MRMNATPMCGTQAPSSLVTSFRGLPVCERPMASARSFGDLKSDEGWDGKGDCERSMKGGMERATVSAR